MNKLYKINDFEYELTENYKDGFDEEIIKEKVTEYFDEFDYILGDWSYGKLRLKGFCDKKNKNFKPYNDIDTYKDYLKNDCAYDCKWFILKKMNQI